MGAGESLDDGVLHILLILGGLHFGLAGQYAGEYLADGFTRGHLFVVMGILHITERNAICTVPVLLGILCRGSNGAADYGCH